MKTATRSLRLLAACIGVTSGISAVASAAIPLYAGPGGPVTPNGLRDPISSLSQPVSNTGVSIALATSYVGGISGGQHGFRWGASASPIVRMGGLAGNTLASATYAVGSSGVVAGFATVSNGDQRAVRYGAGLTTAIPLGTLTLSSANVGFTNAYLINSNNDTAGYGSLYSGSTNLGTRAIHWTGQSNTAIALGVINTNLDGFADSSASAINENGTIVGVASKYNAAGVNLGDRAVRWASGSIIPFELDTPFTRGDGQANVLARGVNLNGTAVGTVEKWAGNSSQGDRAVRWLAGGTAAEVLGTLGTDVNGVGDAFVGGINDAGTTVGYTKKFSASNVSLGYRAVRWNAGETVATELGMLPGVNSDAFAASSAYRMNSIGTAVGEANAVSGVIHAAIWPGGGTAAIDLNSLLSDNTRLLYRTWGISDTGFVTGDSQVDVDGPGGAAAYKQSFMMLVPQAGTYGRGDANFDTHVDFDDLLLLAQHYGQSNASNDIHVGDLNLDGTVNFDDLLALAQHYGPGASVIQPDSLGTTFASDWALAQAMTPEPASLLAIAAMGLVTRRRRD